MKAKEVRLAHGVQLDKDGAIAPATHLTPYTLELLEAVDGVDSVTVTANSLGQVLDIHAKVSDEFKPNTQQYVDAVFAENLARRCTPALSKAQIKQLAGADHDALARLLDAGVDPDGNQAFRAKGDAAVEKNATLRLHTMRDREIAEQRLTGTAKDDYVTYNAYLVWYVTRFGEADFGARPKVSFNSFLNVTWNDFQLLVKGLVARDYKPLTDILDGKLEVDGKTIPFQDVPEPHAEAAAAAPKRGRGKPG